MNYNEAKNKMKAYLVKQAIDTEDVGAVAEGAGEVAEGVDPRLLAAMIPLAGGIGAIRGGLTGAGLHGAYSKARGQKLPQGIWPGMKTGGKYGMGIGGLAGLGVGGYLVNHYGLFG